MSMDLLLGKSFIHISTDVQLLLRKLFILYLQSVKDSIGDFLHKEYTQPNIREKHTDYLYVRKEKCL